MVKLIWKRTEKDFWKSRTVAKRRYAIGRYEKRGPGGRPTGVVRYYIVCFAVARSSGRWYPRQLYDVNPRDLREAKALAQRHANGERVAEPDKIDGEREARRQRFASAMRDAEEMYYANLLQRRQRASLDESERGTLH